MIRTLAFAILMAVTAILHAEEDAKPPVQTEADIQAEFWKASAFAQGAHAALRDSMSDTQKQMEMQRDAYNKQADAARQNMVALCAKKEQTLDPVAFKCIVKPAEEPKK